MPQLPTAVLYAFPALLAGQIVLTMAEQIPAERGWAGLAAGLLGTVGVLLMVLGARQIRPGWWPSALFGSGGFLELIGEHFRESMSVLASLAWMAGLALLTVAWLVTARDVWRLVRPR